MKITDSSCTFTRRKAIALYGRQKEEEDKYHHSVHPSMPFTFTKFTHTDTRHANDPSCSKSERETRGGILRYLMLKKKLKRNQGSQVPTTDENFSNQTQMI